MHGCAYLHTDCLDASEPRKPCRCDEVMAQQLGFIMVSPNGDVNLAYKAAKGEAMTSEEKTCAKESSPKPYLLVKDFLKALGDAGILHYYPQYNRVVIDANIENGLVMMYVSHIPSEALLNIVPLMENITFPKVMDDTVR